MDTVDRMILNKIQKAFPLDPYPYRLIGSETGIPEVEVWKRVEDLRQTGIIRRLGGIFDSRRLGYVSTLCAAKVPPEKIPILAELSQGITEITHNYLRNHLFNMWFTVIASSQERLEAILAQVRTALGSDDIYSLPALKVFKIKVIFDFHSENTHTNHTRREDVGIQDEDMDEDIDEDIDIDEDEEADDGTNADAGDIGYFLTKKDNELYVLTEEDKNLIRRLQDDLPNSLTPYTDLAAALGWDEEQIMSGIRRLYDYRILRRIGAILYHHKAGFTANAMGVWIVPEESVQEVGTRMAEFKEVSHCYQRPAFPDWPYNLFTMIHGQSDQACEQIMARLSQATGIKEYGMLFSESELKKSSMRYFIE